MVKEFFVSKTFAGIALMVAGYFFGGDIAAATLSSNPQMLDTVTTIVVSAGAALASFGGWRRVKKTEDLRTLVDTTSNITDKVQDRASELAKKIKVLQDEVDSLKNSPPSVAETAKVMSQHAKNRKVKVKNPLA